MIRLIHWNAVEAKECAAKILSAGYEVDYSPFTPKSVRELSKQPPEAIVIDLSRQPSQGRDVAANLRQCKVLRTVPFIFVGGQAEKVARIQLVFPGLIYGDWPRIADSLKEAINKTRPSLGVSASNFEAYKDVPLAKKLGITKGQIIRLVGAPEDFEVIVGAIPDGAVLTRSLVRSPDITIWFVTSRAELARRIVLRVKAAGRGRLWIAWPKKTGRIKTDLSQTAVREAGLSNGLVDYKISSMNEIWSALLFTRRQRERKNP